MKPLYLIIAANIALLNSASAADPDKPEISKKPAMAGKFVAKDDLPQAVKSDAKKEGKFPGFPSCAKGRIVTTTWPDSVEKTGHKCADASELYVCASFGRLSVRCE